MATMSPPTVLVVDDESDYVDTMAMLLQTCGYRVLTASDGAVAQQVLNEHRVHVVLTDLAMPRLDGYRLLSAVRADPRCVDTLVIAVSGWGGRETSARCAEAGFDAFFVKPCNLRDLLWTVAAGLARQPVLARHVSPTALLRE